MSVSSHSRELAVLEQSPCNDTILDSFQGLYGVYLCNGIDLICICDSGFRFTFPIPSYPPTSFTYGQVHGIEKV